MFYEYRHHQPILLRCLQAKQESRADPKFLSCESGIHAWSCPRSDLESSWPMYLMNDRPVDLLGSAAQRLTVGVGNFDEFWPWDIRRCQHSTGSMQAQTFQLGEMDAQEKGTSLVAYTVIQPDTLLVRDLWKNSFAWWFHFHCLHRLRLGHRDVWRSVSRPRSVRSFRRSPSSQNLFAFDCYLLVFQAVTVLTEHHPTIGVFHLQQICCQLLFKKLQKPCFWWLLGCAVPFISRYITTWFDQL